MSIIQMAFSHGSHDSWWPLDVNASKQWSFPCGSLTSIKQSGKLLNNMQLSNAAAFINRKLGTPQATTIIGAVHPHIC